MKINFSRVAGAIYYQKRSSAKGQNNMFFYPKFKRTTANNINNVYNEPERIMNFRFPTRKKHANLSVTRANKTRISQRNAQKTRLNVIKYRTLTFHHESHVIDSATPKKHRQSVLCHCVFDFANFAGQTRTGVANSNI